MSWFTDESIDEKTVELEGESVSVGEAIGRLNRRKPDLPRLKAAAQLFDSASPAMIRGCAQWLMLDEELGHQGWSHSERLHAYLRASIRAYSAHGPGSAFLLMASSRVEPETVEALENAARALSSDVESRYLDPVRKVLSRARASAEGKLDTQSERGEDGLTTDVRQALHYLTEKLAEEQLKDGLGPLAESRGNLGINVRAPELASLKDWGAASEARKLEIAKAVEKELAELDISFAGLESYDDAPGAIAIAVFQHDGTGMHLSLVPGGTYQRGFSEREEEVVRKVAKENEGIGNFYEEFEYLFEQAPAMRPVQEVAVEPVLVFQMPAEPRDPAEVTVMLEEMPFRLLTEAEFEWVSRGGRESELTWRGDDVPDEAWMEEVMEKGPELRNPFGMAFLGLNPEVLADVWESSYEGAPTDGSARTGDGPRVVRGGAAMVYPWQACGEWQLLTNAVRTGSDGWEYFLSIRPCLGVGMG